MGTTNLMNTIRQARRNVESLVCHGTWEKGVRQYALYLVDSIHSLWDDTRYNSCESWMLAECHTKDKLVRTLLNGSDNWYQFAFNGNGLVYDKEIARTLLGEKTANRLLKRYGTLQYIPVMVDDSDSLCGWDVKRMHTLQAESLALEQAADIVCNAFNIN